MDKYSLVLRLGFGLYCRLLVLCLLLGGSFFSCTCDTSLRPPTEASCEPDFQRVPFREWKQGSVAFGCLHMMWGETKDDVLTKPIALARDGALVSTENPELQTPVSFLIPPEAKGKRTRFRLFLFAAPWIWQTELSAQKERERFCESTEGMKRFDYKCEHTTQCSAAIEFRPVGGVKTLEISRGAGRACLITYAPSRPIEPPGEGRFSDGGRGDEPPEFVPEEGGFADAGPVEERVQEAKEKVREEIRPEEFMKKESEFFPENSTPQDEVVRENVREETKPQCSQDSECPDFGLCLAGVCCPAGTLSLCNQVCTNTNKSSSHCGGCGKTCSGTCVNGCCSTTQKVCGVRCVDVLTDVNNCGACKNKCDLGDVCINGKCKTPCAPNNYKSLLNDPNNCGICKRACNVSKEKCVAGLCQSACPAGGTKDTRNDPQNCGTCGTACFLPKFCGGGRCLSQPSFQNARMIQMITDSNGRLLMVGTFLKGKVRIGKLEFSASNTGVFVTQFTKELRPIWTRAWLTSLTSSNATEGTSLAVDSDDNVYFTTSAYGVLRDIRSPAVEFKPSNPNSGARDAVFGKLDKDGKLQWVRFVSSKEDEEPFALVWNRFNNKLYATGKFHSVRLSSGLVLELKSTRWVTFLIQISPRTGDVESAYFFSFFSKNPLPSYGRRLAVNPKDGSIGILGTVSVNPQDLDSSQSLTMRGHNKPQFYSSRGKARGGQDVFFLYVRINGGPLWTRMIGSSGFDQARGLSIFENKAHIFLENVKKTVYFGDKDYQSSKAGELLVASFALGQQPAREWVYQKLAGRVGFRVAKQFTLCPTIPSKLKPTFALPYLEKSGTSLKLITYESHTPKLIPIPFSGVSPRMIFGSWCGLLRQGIREVLVHTERPLGLYPFERIRID